MRRLTLVMIVVGLLCGCGKEKTNAVISAEQVDRNFEIESFLGYEFGKPHKEMGMEMMEVSLPSVWMGFNKARLFFPSCVYEVSLCKMYDSSDESKKSAIASIDELARMFVKKYPICFGKKDTGNSYARSFWGESSAVFIDLVQRDGSWGVELSVRNLRFKKEFEKSRPRKKPMSDFDRM